jgi:hypothetical protein
MFVTADCDGLKTRFFQAHFYNLLDVYIHAIGSRVITIAFTTTAIFTSATTTIKQQLCLQ